MPRLALITLLVSLACGACADASRQALCIHTLSGDVIRFQVELANSAEARATGLMHRNELAKDEGMLFDFEQQRPIAMWMKNTPLSLDILFIGETGRIQRIAKDTEPFSLTRIPSGRPARAVLEVLAGSSERLNIKVGDQVAHPIFGSDCD